MTTAAYWKARDERNRKENLVARNNREGRRPVCTICGDVPWRRAERAACPARAPTAWQPAPAEPGCAAGYTLQTLQTLLGIDE